MFTKKFVGWAAWALFVVAVVILAILVLLVFSPSLANLVRLNPQAMIVVSGVLALMATVFGFYAFKTTPGKVLKSAWFHLNATGPMEGTAYL